MKDRFRIVRSEVQNVNQLVGSGQLDVNRGMEQIEHLDGETRKR